MIASPEDPGIGRNRRSIDARSARTAFNPWSCLALLLAVCAGPAAAKPPRAATAPAAADAERPERPAAMVNGSEISQGELAAECLSRHGAAVTEMLVNRRIIEQACVRQGVVVTPQDVDADIDAMARRFNLPRDKWIELIQQERGVTPKQYADEIVWPMIALRRLAHAGIEPGEADIVQAFENQFGPAVKARIVVVRSRAEAEQVRAAAIASPDDFGAIARQRSVDVGSASANGWVNPIRRHAGDPEFERVVFTLQPGAISEVVQVADQFIVIKCEGRLPASGVKLDDVRQRLVEELRERRSRAAAGEVFRRLQDESTVENVLNDAAKSAASQGVAARVNGDPIGLDQVREACVARHGRETLEILITRRLIEQALTRDRQTVSQAEVDGEIARAAEAMGFRRPDGSPDVSAWLERVTRDEKLPMRHYIEDIVRPSVALKKLVGKVPVSKEDLDKAFEATFGPRARCRVIILDSQRRAQEVWQLARENPTAERIGELAERYSADPTSKALRGEVPPIQRYGGQPAIEREAFALKPGELSGVVQVADRFMVLFCEGFTEPSRVNPEEVRDELHADIFEKKQRIEMARYFTHLRESAAIDNFLAGTSQPSVQQVAGQRMPPPAGPGVSRPSDGATLSRAEAEALAAPRAGSRRAAPPAGGVVPASLDEPIRATRGGDGAR
ncbi:MAG: peptidylprolyl isomerase [Planctomycetia bacterium]|nr:peptidylprolyl isomerase [Planctomycetia bacterium]